MRNARRILGWKRPSHKPSELGGEDVTIAGQWWRKIKDVDISHVNVEPNFGKLGVYPCEFVAHSF